MSDVLKALWRRAATHPEEVAFADGAGIVDYRTLARRVAGFAEAAAKLPECVGLLAPSSIDWAIADLGLWLAGRAVVPLPHFFSDDQLRHIVSDAGIGAVLASHDQMDRGRTLGAPVRPLQAGEGQPGETGMSGRRIVYTSGSSGNPKGVILESEQIVHTCTALIQAVAPGPADRHLSVLPFSLLLEAICGIYLPLLAGGSCRIAADVVAAKGIDVAVRLGETAAAVAPTTSVLVPQLLQAWVMIASVGRVEVPPTLRFVAVGGAKVPEPLAARAWELGIPVHEGYGLTECGSVVAVNVPGHRKPGTVGRPLPGYDVEIADNGEIVVTSPSVTPGYLGAASGTDGGRRRWPTGDLGSLDTGGYLRVDGRKDNLIATANGRNVSPEWVEAMLLADPRIAQAVVLATPAGELAAIVEPSSLGEAWFSRADERQLAETVDSLCATAPAYAVPRTIIAIAIGELAAQGLLTGNGRPRRKAIAERFHDRLSKDPLPTEAENHAVL